MRVTHVPLVLVSLAGCADEPVDQGAPVDLQVNIAVSKDVQAWLDGEELPMKSVIRESFASLRELRRFRLHVLVEKGESTRDVVIASNCSVLGDGDGFEREVLDVGFYWNAREGSVASSASGSCFYPDGAEVGWVAD